MASQGHCLLESGILPYNDLVVRIPMGTHDFFGVLGEHQVAYLRTCIDTIYHSIIEGVPEFNGLISWAAATGENSVVVRTPCDSFDCSAVGGKFTNRGGTFGAPDEKLIIVSSWGKKVIIKRPFQAADFLGVALVFIYDSIVSLTNVSHQDATISRSTC